ncbi:hypothetical protein BLD48_14490 [Exiguobacterium sp. KRL4]|uniref:GNAT family N-acetyltransferase n=1 Tax=Exiguobacterium sp. KRL4 TaxID=1914536 RepID=UPI0008F815E3|nr:GNAT family N-acetyltransferase [Exiguobacterium sp. KRL4]OIN65701.1 hypothetical protein BLD48_14490 [Exiguobacterium sp. KRL4]
MIELRKMDEADYPAYATLVMDERVMRYITEHALTESEAKRRFASIIERQRHDRLGTYVVYQDETWIGIGHVTRSVRQPFEAEIGYMLLPEQWGNGYGSLLASRLLELATEHELTVVTATIDPNHVASRKILTNLGFHSTYVGPIDGLPGEIFEKRLGDPV